MITKSFILVCVFLISALYVQAQTLNTKIELKLKPEMILDSQPIKRPMLPPKTGSYRNPTTNELQQQSIKKDNLELNSINGRNFDPLNLSQQPIRIDFKLNRENSFWDKPGTQFILPAALITYGVSAQFIKPLEDLDRNIDREIGRYNKISIDNYLRYTPAVAAMGLDFVGIKAKHNFRDRAMVMATAYLVSKGTVRGLKMATKKTRPDGGIGSFPSSHTASAFVGAHILYKEYKDTSIWIGVGGYAIATTTASLRMINHKHWMSDVVMGAGVGILSAEVGYLMLPVWHKLFGIKDKDKSLVIVPTISPEQAGVGVSYTF